MRKRVDSNIYFSLKQYKVSTFNFTNSDQNGDWNIYVHLKPEISQKSIPHLHSDHDCKNAYFK